MTNLNTTVDALSPGRLLTDSGPISHSKDPLLIWTTYAFIMICILFITLKKTLFAGLSADSSYFSLIIAVTFIGAFLYSFVEARKLHQEWVGINQLQPTLLENARRPNSEAEKLVAAIMKHDRPEILRIKDLVDSYYSGLEVPLRTLAMISSLMVTLGLVGTILGLIISIGGLEDLMSHVEGLNKGVLGGVKETIRGMSIAFYSTLLGAVLGAVILRMLSVSLINSLVRMSCGLFEYLELLPKTNELRLMQPLREATETFSELIEVTATASSELRKFASATLDSRLVTISAQLELCAAALRDVKR
jgi:biopolymer transport protein ExbB/TolQ